MMDVEYKIEGEHLVLNNGSNNEVEYDDVADPTSNNRQQNDIAMNVLSGDVSNEEVDHYSEIKDLENGHYEEPRLFVKLTCMF